jgi:hypothetical protein
MDPATTALIGAGIGGVVSITTALVTPWVSSRFAMQQFAREAEQEKRQGLEAVLDEAGLALEEAHWSIRHALTVKAEPDFSDGGSGQAPGPEPSPRWQKQWRAAFARMEEARAATSRQGTRLAVRLGGPERSGCVAAYNHIKDGYWKLLGEVMDAGLEGKLETQKIDNRLKRLGDDQRFHDEASKLLTPVTVREEEEQPSARADYREPSAVKGESPTS